MIVGFGLLIAAVVVGAITKSYAVALLAAGVFALELAAEVKL